MNNYRNYGNNGYRRPAGNLDDCGCKKKEEKPDMGCGCMEKKSDMGRGYMEKKQDMGRGYMERKSDMDCGCREKKQDMDCGCREKKQDMDCGCMEKKDENDCGCKEEKRECLIESMYREVKKNGACRECMDDMPGKALAMAYVPWQTWKKLYEVCEGFSTGTIFRELDLEFYGRRCN